MFFTIPFITINNNINKSFKIKSSSKNPISKIMKIKNTMLLDIERIDTLLSKYRKVVIYLLHSNGLYIGEFIVDVKNIFEELQNKNNLEIGLYILYGSLTKTGG